MKKVCFVFLVILFDGLSLFSQPCNSFYSFTSQDSIDQFAVNYPNCTEWTESIYISGQDITNLEGLSTIKSIKKVLTIDNCPLLTHLNGLGNLISVGSIVVTNNASLVNFTGLNDSIDIQRDLEVSVNGALTSLEGLGYIDTLDHLWIISNPLLTDLSVLQGIATIKYNLGISRNTSLSHLNCFQNLTHLGALGISENPMLSSITGFEGITNIQYVSIIKNPLITTFNNLKNASVLESIYIYQNASLKSIDFSNVTALEGDLTININPNFENLSGIKNIQSIGGYCIIDHIKYITDFEDFNKLTSIGAELQISRNESLLNLNGLEHISSVRQLFISQNPSLKTLSGLENTQVLNSLNISYNDSLINLTALKNLVAVESDFGINSNKALTSLSDLENLLTVGGYIQIQDNPLLSDCSVFGICDRLLNAPQNLVIENNALGCNSLEEAEVSCAGKTVIVSVLMDNNTNCTTDTMDIPLPQATVHLNGNIQHTIRPTHPNGQVQFGYLDSGIFSLSLPQFPNDNWAVCIDTIWINPDTFPDTIKTTFLLTPLTQCPDLSVDLGLPTFFRGCLATTPVQVKVTNLGTITAEDVQVALVMPFDMMELVSSTPPVTAQNGDTLFFTVGNLPALEFTSVNLTVKTRCDTFLLDQSICMEAFAGMSNPCPSIPLSFSEIRVYSECLSDTTVRFTLKNVGNAPTQALHEYVIIEDEVILKKNWFTLAPQESMIVDIAADGSTFRLEATQFEDGSKTATAIENCGGLTPGFITAYWIDEGVKDYDFDCRRVVLAYDPNQKSAIPTGVGPEHLLAANRPIQYTIDFQNTGTDTAFRVLLRDVLSPNLDVNTFSPGFASHPYDWEIRDGNTLDVTFSPIALPDSNVNEAASHGFFSFTIQQKNNLPYGTVIENSAAIIFDFNPPIITNTVFHTIGELLVSAEEPQLYPQLWQIMNNPMKSSATFRAEEGIRGEKQFDLIDTGGRIMYSEKFYDQEFTFERGNFGSGLYFFRIVDDQGRVFSGKVVISE